MADRILGDDSRALADDELVDAVVDFRVDMIGAARQHNDALALGARTRDDLGALGAHLGHVALILGIGGVDGLRHGPVVKAGEILVRAPPGNVW